MKIKHGFGEDIICFGCLLVEAGPKENHLKKHNELRRRHGSPDLILDDKLSAQCEAYAKILAKKRQLIHSTDAKKYGENLCMRSSKPMRCDQMWYDEIALYDYDNPGFSMSTGHFTALVWKNTKIFGYGQAQDKHGFYWVVARYYPPGNYRGEYEENVPRPLYGKVDYGTGGSALRISSSATQQSQVNTILKSFSWWRYFINIVKQFLCLHWL
ncbi:Golgi-associated plant pathogenesis-related protein 1-like isoform X2 [Drosophila eugracilis]|uniref:Golgi-associated plant pathogenesis-related protein 1-like isoform X2 n=1 Tax=Drosophila eugracilis TaxID=29029 RepID=UPI001BD9EA23|nr:Golgi-associated plant pathogenesis-related protein 1-like isoform X2 [Drosophila eugracilis]